MNPRDRLHLGQRYSPLIKGMHYLAMKRLRRMKSLPYISKREKVELDDVKVLKFCAGAGD